MKKIVLAVLCLCLAIPQCYAADIAPVTEEIELRKWNVLNESTEWSFSEESITEGEGGAVAVVDGEAFIEWTAPDNTTVSIDVCLKADEAVSGAVCLDEAVFPDGNMSADGISKNFLTRVNKGQKIKLALSSDEAVSVAIDFEISEVLLGLVPDRLYTGEWEMYTDYKATTYKGLNADNTKLIWGDSYGSDGVWEFYFDDDGVMGKISEETAGSKWMRKEEGAAANQLGSLQFNANKADGYLSRGHYDNVTVWNSPVDSVVAVNMDVLMDNPKGNRQTHFALYKNEKLISSFYMIGTTEADVSKSLTEYVSVEKNDKVILRVYVTDKSGNEVEDSSKGNSYQLDYSIKETPEIQLNAEPVFSLDKNSVSVTAEIYNPSGAEQNVVLMLAVYDENDSLISASGKTPITAPGKIVTENLSVEGLNSYSKARLYVWDSYAKMKPYYESIEQEVE